MLSALIPTEKLNIGHWFSVIKPARSGVTILIADYHAPQFSIEKILTLRDEILRHAPEANVIIQSDIFNSEFYFQLASVVPASEINSQTLEAILWAHDIAGYKEVRIDASQESAALQALKILSQFNEAFDDELTVPTLIINDPIFGLDDPSLNMADVNTEGSLFLSDSEEEIANKIRKASTSPEGLMNLAFLYKEFSEGTMPEGDDEMKVMLTAGILSRIDNSKQLE